MQRLNYPLTPILSLPKYIWMWNFGSLLMVFAVFEVLFQEKRQYFLGTKLNPKLCKKKIEVHCYFLQLALKKGKMQVIPMYFHIHIYIQTTNTHAHTHLHSETQITIQTQTNVECSSVAHPRSPSTDSPKAPNWTSCSCCKVQTVTSF